MSQLSNKFAIPLKIVLPYFIVGVASYFLFFVMIGLETIFGVSEDKILATVHIFGVGFLLSFFFGSSLQLFPVILNVPHRFEYIFSIVFWTLLAGFGMLIIGFWYINYLLKIGALLIIVAFVLYLAENFMTILQLKKYNFYTIAILVSHLYLMFGFIVGFLMVLVLLGEINLDIALLLPLHISFVLGYMLILISTISITLIPMFSLSNKFSQIYIKMAISIFYIIPPLALLGQFDVLRVLYGLGLLLLFVQGYVLYKKRVRKEMDVYFYSIVIAYMGVLVSGVLMIFSDYYSSIFVLLVWFMGFMITGHLYKIVPFLAWFEYYSPLVGKQKVPLLNQMVSKKYSKQQLMFSFFGMICLSMGFYFDEKNLVLFGSLLSTIGAFYLARTFYLIFQKDCLC